MVWLCITDSEHVWLRISIPYIYINIQYCLEPPCFPINSTRWKEEVNSHRLPLHSWANHVLGSITPFQSICSISPVCTHWLKGSVLPVQPHDPLISPMRHFHASQGCCYRGSAIILVVYVLVEGNSGHNNSVLLYSNSLVSLMLVVSKCSIEGSPTSL